MQETSIVVPCFNEAARLLPEQFVAACQREPALHFVFVDDGSSDDTVNVLTRTAEQAPRQIQVLSLEANAGKGEAVRRGVQRAFESTAELVGFWDADLATPLYNIERFAQLLERPQLEMVVGSRVRLLGHDVQRDAARHYIGRCFATVSALALRLPVYDTQCGAKLFRANATFREAFAKPFELGWSFDVELFARVSNAWRRQQLDPEQRIMEAPLDQWIDAPGSKLRPSHFPRIAWELCKLFAIARRG